jgi:hypothetical protein
MHLFSHVVSKVYIENTYIYLTCVLKPPGDLFRTYGYCGCYCGLVLYLLDFPLTTVLVLEENHNFSRPIMVCDGAFL